MNPYIFIGLPTVSQLHYLNESQNMILEIISKITEVSVSDIVGQSRIKKIVIARHYSVYFLKKYTHMTLKNIGDILGNRDHSTIRSSLESFDNLLIYPDFKSKAVKIEGRILEIQK